MRPHTTTGRPVPDDVAKTYQQRARGRALTAGDNNGLHTATGKNLKVPPARLPRPEMTGLELYVNGQRVATNRFVSGVLKDILEAFLKNLRDVEAGEVLRVDIKTT